MNLLSRKFYAINQMPSVHLNHWEEIRGPFLKMMETTCKVGEEPVDTYRIDPVIKFLIWILMKVEVDKVILISESIWMHLQ